MFNSSNDAAITTTTNNNNNDNNTINMNISVIKNHATNTNGNTSAPSRPSHIT